MWRALSSLNLTLALLLVCCAHSEHNHIVSDNFVKLCRVRDNCLTLAEYVAKPKGKPFDIDNISLFFSSGAHTLTQSLEFNGITTVTLTGERNGSSTIMCEKSGSFDFELIKQLNITWLTLTGCESDQNGGAISIRSAGNVTINNCQFVGNHARDRGGAIYIFDITGNTNVIVKNSKFQNNSALHNNGFSSGGAIYFYGRQLSIIGCNYTNNTADDGGAISIHNGRIESKRSFYTENRSTSSNGYGGAISVFSGHLTSDECHFQGNSAARGGSISVHKSDMSTRRSYYRNNSAVSSNSANALGGAIYVSYSSMFSSNNFYTNNTAKKGGATSMLYGNLSIEGDVYANNTSLDDGGAIHAWRGNMYCTTSGFKYNKAESGGAIDIHNGTYISTKCYFTQNMAFNGGAISTFCCKVYGQNNNFTDNTAELTGGAIEISHGRMFGEQNHFSNNKAMLGGAIRIADGTISSLKGYYKSNYAKSGGAIYTDGSRSFTSCSSFTNDGTLYEVSSYNQISGSVFVSNTAHTGASIYWTNLYAGVTIHQSNFTNNNAYSGEVVYISDTLLICMNEVFFMCNNGSSVNAFNAQVELRGRVTFMNNNGTLGGAIRAIQSNVLLNTTSTISIRDNVATYGGGIYLIESSLHIYYPVDITGNRALVSGGGVYAYQSEIEFEPERSVGYKLSQEELELESEWQDFDFTLTEENTTNISRNIALEDGGGIYTIGSNIKISQTIVHFDSNTAQGKGGAMFLEQNSKIYLYKKVPEICNWVYLVRLDFSNNSAEYGGAIYVMDNPGTVCQGTNHIQSFGSTECFIQTLKLYQKKEKCPNIISTFFVNNTATAGDDIYGGLLDRCTINSRAELLAYFTEFSLSTGFDYLKTTAQFDKIVDYNHLRTVDLVEAISKSSVKKLITSDAVQVMFCRTNSANTSRTHPSVRIKKGNIFKVSLAAVDQVGNLLSAKIISSVFSKSGKNRLKEGQTEQTVAHQCTELEYNVYSQDTSAQLHIYANGPCDKLGVSKLVLNISFLPCDCPIGFQPSKSTTECVCDCDQRLKKFQITNCSAENETIRVETPIWIGVSDIINKTGYIIHNCPFDYCVEKPVNISLNNPDEQCAYHRTGLLCGQCEEGLSLVFATSRCMKCSNYFLFLLIPFALAGILQVAFILLLNVTIATGTIHGLIFYANILGANRSIFLQLDTRNFLTVFMSWVNLDLGIETCFYNGMNSQAKVLLQLVFPAYLFLLIFLIILLCEYSKRFSTLLANRNPIAALCTLILLSYSKLLRMIILSLQYAFLDYPDGTHQTGWLYDGNVPYFSTSHIPRFIAAFLILLLGSVYTILLFFGQWLPRCSNWKIMKWTKNTKYNAFVDAYHAPFTPKHRYWMGLLLFAQIVHNLIAALTPDSPAPIISAGTLALGLILLRIVNTRIYKNWLQDLLETLFLINIVVLSIATNREKENQPALANTSMCISFVLALVILTFHIYKYTLRDTRVWLRLKQTLGHWRRGVHRREMDQFVRDQDDELIDNKEYHNEVIERDTIDPPYTGDSREQTNPPHYITPPIIRPAVRYDQLREPDLDILNPINSDDYRVPPNPIHVHEPPVITYTVIDVIPKPNHTDLQAMQNV